MRMLLGTFVEIGADGDDPCTLRAVDEAFAGIATLQRLLSFQDPDSELSRLNSRPGEWVPMSRPSLRVLRLARGMGRASGGHFNCTVGGRLVAEGVLPDHGGPSRLCSGTADDIRIRPGAAMLARPVLVTLDGIAKGYAVDVAIATLRRRRLAFGWVNAGGDLRVFGARRMQIYRREVESGVQELTTLRDAALATSRAGAHADPDLPGRIVRACGPPGACADISVIARRAWRADALTKVAALAPLHERASLLHALRGRLVTVTRPCNA
jgi:thiamine biosynthesis lipoprotein